MTKPDFSNKARKKKQLDNTFSFDVKNIYLHFFS